MPIRTHILGFPRIGAARELKLALESHWRGEVSEAALEATGQQLRARHWAQQRDAGLDYVTVGDFALYDQVASHIQLLGCEPARFNFTPEQSPLARYFTMARGAARHAQHADCGHAHHSNAAGTAALEMSKWFDTNYHYLVPELSPQTQFSLAGERLLAEVAEAQTLGHKVKAALIGPLTFLWLGKEKTPGESGFHRLALLEQLLPVYGALLDRLKQQGVTWVQLDEPILGLDLPNAWRSAFESAYWQLNQVGVNILLATYFSPLEENLSLTCRLPVAGLHVDGIRAPHELISVTDWLPAHKVLSIGIVDGRNIWRTDLDAALAVLQPLAARRNGQLWLAPSCSLLHVPFSLEAETALDGEIKRWLAFATEKLTELSLLKNALAGHPDAAALAASRLAIAGRRASHQRGKLAGAGYEQQVRAEISHAVGRQETLGLDVLVHGEAERNDMADYFDEQLDGFIFTRLGWVQSYGARCVKPPIIYGDVQHPAAMTVAWPVHAQSLTHTPVKGILTGPVTLLQWSFVRDDQPRAATALQLALAIRDEVADLETAGIGIIQIDEPAMREGLPLRRGQWVAYLEWATRAFRIAASVVKDTTQIHTRMWVNPDCGLETRGWTETEAALKNMVAAAQQMRAA
ncbi:MAG: 5-methyltetrahydropteroyltriglutamate--homocysteine S-methyltransferase [Janthinobacterium svalbardensis]|uniref:5-methyltetrahydropteroyltriglutamate--homocysteine S-methyltransferase n=1 Tax=Janthinobacterium svalbardensis TaxID=368607 RepID=A0A290WQF0_9BURK|nr:5-methyltetrahydropteroyltriglutamate--homocysteine S-methyltransferase [Janthinobacterium svalbardensis]ATD59115.1 5-methyltetrahydropteroyltriglutamate--homocysteine S-methyltransferase [Janthinobacterium svalbardensis]